MRKQSISNETLAAIITGLKTLDPKTRLSVKTVEALFQTEFIRVWGVMSGCYKRDSFHVGKLVIALKAGDLPWTSMGDKTKELIAEIKAERAAG